MTETATTTILLVRALEDTWPDAVPATIEQKAVDYAGDPAEEEEWFARRATFLLAQLPAAYRSILQLSTIPPRWSMVIGGGAGLLGLASNYLNPSGKIHALWNPMVLLVLWNLLIYILLCVEWLHRRRHSRKEAGSSPTPSLKSRSSSRQETVSQATEPSFLARNFRKIFPTLWAWTQKATRHYETLHRFTRIAVTFWSLWLAVASPIAMARLRRLLHSGAIGLALGAVMGSYIRGLFFEYNVVWRSTFIRDAASAGLLLKMLLSPAALLFGWDHATLDNVPQLMTTEGAPAAPWIHLYAATVFVCIVLPRLALIGWIRGGAVAPLVISSLIFMIPITGRASSPYVTPMNSALHKPCKTP